MKCLYCNKKLELREGQKQLNPSRKYCDRVCQTRYKAREWYKDNKDKPEFKVKAKRRMKNWYSNNKERQNKNTMNDYYKHKEIWNQRHLIYDHRDKIIQFINPLCSCGKPIKIIMHKTFGDYPRLVSRGQEKENLKLIEKYTKENLIGVCSKLCLEKEKRR